MDHGICGNCEAPFQTPNSKTTTIVSSWNKQRHPQCIPIYEALAVVFEIPPLTPNENGALQQSLTKKDFFRRGSEFTSCFDDDANNKESDSLNYSHEKRWGFCSNCSELLTLVYNCFQEFTSVCKAESEVAKVLKKIELNRKKPTQVSSKAAVSDAEKRGDSDPLNENSNTYIKLEPPEEPENDLDDNDGLVDPDYGPLNSPLLASIKQPPASPPEFLDDGVSDGGQSNSPVTSQINASDSENPQSNETETQEQEKAGTSASLRERRSRRNAAKALAIDYVECSSTSNDENENHNPIRREIDGDEYPSNVFNPTNKTNGPVRSALRPQVTVVRSGSTTIRQFQCPLCEKVFLHENILDCHRRIIHREKITLRPPHPIPQLACFRMSKEMHEKALKESAGKKSTCPVCHLSVPRNAILNHLSIHTRSISRPWLCTLCGRDCQSHEALLDHTRSHQACVPCKHCGRRVARLEMINHLKRCVSLSKTKTPFGLVWTCKLCQVKFTEKHLMIQHMKSHKQKKAFSCKICDKTFNSLAVQRLHIRRFHRNNESGPPSVRSHLPVHNDGDDFHDDDDGGGVPTEVDPLSSTDVPKPMPPQSSQVSKNSTEESNILPIIDDRYACKACDFQCMETKQMENHLRETHADHSTLTCNICKRKLQDEFCLNLHLNSHSETKPMECYICQKTYSQKQNFYYHLKDRHSLETKMIIFKYPLIFSAARTAKGLRIRGQKVQTPSSARGEYPCELCGKVFPYLHSVRNHRKIVHDKVREFVCSYCGKCFPRKSYFLLHEKLHTTTETPYKCHLCGKGFRLPGNLRMHLQSTIHNPNKSFICEVCGKGFNRMDNMRLHVKAVHLKLPTRRPRNQGQGQPQRGIIGRRRVYGAGVDGAQKDGYVPNLPSTSGAQGIIEIANQRALEFDNSNSMDETSSQLSSDMKSSENPAEGQGHGMQHLANLHIPSLGHQHSHSQPQQNLVETALHLAQAEFQTMQQSHLGFSFRGSSYR